MEELTLYQKILESNLVNFIIMVSILVLIFKKAKLGAIFDKMASDIQNSVMSSADAAQAALKEYKEAKRSTKNTAVEKEEILNKAKNTAENMENTAASILQKEEAALDEKCGVQIENSVQKARENTAGEIYETVTRLAEAEIKNRILNPENRDEIQSKIIDKCIKELDTLNDAALFGTGE